MDSSFSQDDGFGGFKTVLWWPATGLQVLAKKTGFGEFEKVLWWATKRLQVDSGGSGGQLKSALVATRKRPSLDSR